MAQYTLASNVANVQTVQNPIPPAPVPPAPPPPSGAPTATAIEYVNVRTGPGTNYPVLGIASPGASAEVTGKSADGAYWQVKIPTQYSSSGLGWVSAGYVVTQNTQNVPVVAAPARRLSAWAVRWSRRPRRITRNSPREQASPPHGCCRTRGPANGIKVKSISASLAQWGISACTRVRISTIWLRPCSLAPPITSPCR
jgi:uncharacterized protein YraI